MIPVGNIRRQKRATWFGNSLQYCRLRDRDTTTLCHSKRKGQYRPVGRGVEIYPLTYQVRRSHLIRETDVAQLQIPSNMMHLHALSSHT